MFFNIITTLVQRLVAGRAVGTSVGCGETPARLPGVMLGIAVIVSVNVHRLPFSIDTRKVVNRREAESFSLRA